MRGEFGTFGYDEKELHHDEDDRLDTKYQDNVTTARNPQRLQQDRILPGKLIDYREWDGRDHEVYLQQRHNTAQGESPAHLSLHHYSFYRHLLIWWPSQNNALTLRETPV
ncbi:hypothetical protein SK128_009946 [Halocaridina rubra]|uniref:Uncharacterized protein n=1 Tax=Halocaridina rubra TaxID=373956 RepID=A0AAN9ACM7_HALRR